MHHFKKFHLLTVVITCLTTISIVGVFYYKINSDVEKENIKLRKTMNERTHALDHFMNQLIRQVDIIEKETENYYAQPINRQAIVGDYRFSSLKQYSATHYGSDNVADSLKPLTSSILGKGHLKTLLADQEFIEELGLQFKLSSLFASVKSQFSDIAWAHSISERNFINVFPFIRSNVTEFNDNFRQYEFYKMCKPESNASREIKVAPVYVDAGGQGLMVTIAKPFYEGQRFAGVVAVDVTLSALTNYLREFQIASNSSMLIVNDYGQVVASYPQVKAPTDSTVAMFKEIYADIDPSLPDSIYHLKSGTVAEVSSFSSVKWKMVYVAPDESWLFSKDGRLFTTFMIAFVGLTFALLFFTYRNFVNPSRQLVQFIDNQRAGILDKPKVHFAWQDWFTVVERSFELNRKAIETLDLKVKEKTAALSESNKLLEDQKEALERANRTKDKLFSVIAHDLKVPINSLAGMLGILRQGHVTQDEFNSLSADLMISLKKISSLLENLLHWSMDNIKHKSLNFDMLDIDVLIRENLQLYEFIAREKNIRFHYDGNSSVAISSNKYVVDLVLRNLLINAIKFSYACSIIEVHVSKNIDSVIVCIKDYGKGIPAELADKLFHGESRAGTNNEKGTGLGLSLCQEFLHRVGGEIWVKSEEGKGSEFSFSLPVNGLAKASSTSATADVILN